MWSFIIPLAGAALLAVAYIFRYRILPSLIDRITLALCAIEPSAADHH